MTGTAVVRAEMFGGPSDGETLAMLWPPAKPSIACPGADGMVHVYVFDPSAGPVDVGWCPPAPADGDALAHLQQFAARLQPTHWRYHGCVPQAEAGLT